MITTKIDKGKDKKFCTINVKAFDRKRPIKNRLVTTRKADCVYKLDIENANRLDIVSYHIIRKTYCIDNNKLCLKFFFSRTSLILRKCINY